MPKGVYKDPEARRKRDERVSSLGRSRVGKSNGTKGKTWEEIHGVEKAQEMREKLKNRIHRNKEIQKRKSETLKRTYAKNGGLNHKDDCQCGVCKAKRGEYVGEDNPFFGRKETDEHRAKVGDAIRRSFKNGTHGLCDPEKQRQRTEKALQALMHNRPTSYERIVIDVIEKYDLPFEYVGDGEFWITSHGKHINPDFRDTDGSRVVIEVFCNYWKERTYGSVEQYLVERREQCEDQGYAVVFLNDEDVKEGDEHIRGMIESVHQMVNIKEK